MFTRDAVTPLERRHTRPHRADAKAADALIHKAAMRHDVSPSLISAVAWQESRFRSDAVSPKGALGMMQLMPATAALLHVNANDPAANVDGGTALLAQLLRRFDGDIVRSLAAYNAGTQAVVRYGGIPPYRETRQFVDSILNHLAQTAEANP